MTPSPSAAVPKVETDMSEEHDIPPQLEPSQLGPSPAATMPEAVKIPAGAETATTMPEAATVVAANSRSKSALWTKFTENPLPSVLGGVIVVMLSFVLTTTNARIDDTNARIDDTNDRITSLEAKMDDRITSLEAKMDSKIGDLDSKIGNLDSKIGDLNLKLTALIAALNKTGEVDAALSGAVSSVDA